MPASVVKTKRDERLWKQAKKLAAERGLGDNYAYIMGIYKRSGGLDETASSTLRASLTEDHWPKPVSGVLLAERRAFWIADAVQRPGRLRKHFKKQKGEKITKGELRGLADDEQADAGLRRAANLALTLRKFEGILQEADEQPAERQELWVGGTIKRPDRLCKHLGKRRGEKVTKAELQELAEDSQADAGLRRTANLALIMRQFECAGSGGCPKRRKRLGQVLARTGLGENMEPGEETLEEAVGELADSLVLVSTGADGCWERLDEAARELVAAWEMDADDVAELIEAGLVQLAKSRVGKALAGAALAGSLLAGIPSAGGSAPVKQRTASATVLAQDPTAQRAPTGGTSVGTTSVDSETLVKQSTKTVTDAIKDVMTEHSVVVDFVKTENAKEGKVIVVQATISGPARSEDELKAKVLRLCRQAIEKKVGMGAIQDFQVSTHTNTATQEAVGPLLNNYRVKLLVKVLLPASGTLGEMTWNYLPGGEYSRETKDLKGEDSYVVSRKSGEYTKVNVQFDTANGQRVLHYSIRAAKPGFIEDARGTIEGNPSGILEAGKRAWRDKLHQLAKDKSLELR